MEEQLHLLLSQLYKVNNLLAPSNFARAASKTHIARQLDGTDIRCYVQASTQHPFLKVTIKHLLEKIKVTI